jgi:azurin
LNSNRKRIGSEIDIENDPINEGPVQEKATTILMEIVPELMKFDREVFTVTAGEKIILELDNLDGMQHNLLIIKPGTLEKVGAAADAMLRDPKASKKHYVPEIPEVLFATEMLGPNEVFTLNFTAPTQLGDYPYVCTFPGHWRMMNGIMRVVKP